MCAMRKTGEDEPLFYNGWKWVSSFYSPSVFPLLLSRVWIAAKLLALWIVCMYLWRRLFLCMHKSQDVSFPKNSREHYFPRTKEPGTLNWANHFTASPFKLIDDFPRIDRRDSPALLVPLLCQQMRVLFVCLRQSVVLMRWYRDSFYPKGGAKFDNNDNNNGFSVQINLLNIFALLISSVWWSILQHF